MAFSLLLVALIIGHLLADFYWQPMSWVNDRNTRHFKASKLYFHVLVHGVTSALIITLWEYTFGWQQLSSVLIATASIMLSHYYSLLTAFNTDNLRARASKWQRKVANTAKHICNNLVSNIA